MTTRPEQIQIITDAAREIGTEPAWLDAIINFETGGSYNPEQPSHVVDDYGNPVAWGLIQFRNVSAQDLGFMDAVMLVSTYPTFESQMKNAVVPYFKMKARQNRISSYDTLQALAMAVYYPTYWNKPPTTPFPDTIQTDRIQNPNDYIQYVTNRISDDMPVLGIGRARAIVPIVIGVLGVGALGWWIYQSERRR